MTENPERKSRVAIIALLLISIGGIARAQQQGLDPKQGWNGWKCGRGAGELPYAYELAVARDLEPPNWKGEVISIAVATNTSLDLWTDGSSFKFWTTTTRVTFGQIDKALIALNGACRLPMEPDDAAGLLNVKWESVDISPTEFAQLHQSFLNAVSQYASSAQTRYGRLMHDKSSILHLDTASVRIVYENSHEHIETEVWNDPDENKSMLDWIRGLQKLAEDKFRMPVSK